MKKHFLSVILFSLLAVTAFGQSADLRIVPFQRNGQYGYQDLTNGKVVVEAAYDRAFPFSEGFGRIQSDGAYGFVDSLGNVAVSPRYRDARDFRAGMAAVNAQGLWGFVDVTGERVIECRYEYAEDFAGQTTIVGKDVPEGGLPGGFRGIIDRKGEFLIPMVYQYLENFSQGYAVFGKDGTFGYIDEREKRKLGVIRADGAVSFQNGMGQICRDCRYKLIDGKPTPVGGQWAGVNLTNDFIFIENDMESDMRLTAGIVFTLGYLGPFEDLVAAAYSGGDYNDALDRYTGGKFALVAKDGEMMTSFYFEDMGEFSEGMVAVAVGAKSEYAERPVLRYGYIDMQGFDIVPLEWEVAEAGPFVNGHAILRSHEGKYGYLDAQGQLVSPLVWEEAYPFYEGLAACRKDGKYGWIDQQGQTVIPFRYDKIVGEKGFAEGRALVERAGKRFYIDKAGKCLEHCR